MPREIKSVCDVAPALFVTAIVPDNYRERLLKLIPSEMIVAWIVLQGLIMAHRDNTRLLIAIAFICLLAMTPLYLRVVCRVRKEKQIVLTTAAFVIWVMALGGFHIIYPKLAIFDDNFLGALALLGYTLITPMFYRGYDVVPLTKSESEDVLDEIYKFHQS
jgi:lysylphosphatidylglycerol synthetase-like protein (DUF2156 family)